MAIAFKKATKSQSKLRLALNGPAGSGKTFTALTIAKHLGGKVAVVDTEHGSASKYADRFDFDVLELDNFAPSNFVEAIHTAESEGYSIVILDSITHAWNGTGGVMEIVDNAAARARGNSYAGWKEGTPAHNDLINGIVQSRVHIIATMRAKTEYSLEKDERTGKSTPKKIGMAPVQRDGMEYEFDVSGFLDLDNTLVIDKTRCPALRQAVIKMPGKELADVLSAWLSDGAPAVDAPKLALVPPAPDEKPASVIGPDVLLAKVRMAADVDAVKALAGEITATRKAHPDRSDEIRDAVTARLNTLRTPPPAAEPAPASEPTPAPVQAADPKPEPKPIVPPPPAPPKAPRAARTPLF